MTLDAALSEPLTEIESLVLALSQLLVAVQMGDPKAEIEQRIRDLIEEAARIQAGEE